MKITIYWIPLILFCLIACTGPRETAISLVQRLEMARSYSSEISGDALLVWQSGKLLLEDYQNGYDSTKPHILTESSMLLSGLRALYAAERGILSLHQPVSDVITEWQFDSLKSTITIARLLRHTSGLDPGSGNEVPGYTQALNAPVVDQPGTEFRYGPTGYQVFCALNSRLREEGKLGSPSEQIYNPLQIPGERWQAVSVSVEAHRSSLAELQPRCFDGAHLTARELGRIGRLLLQDGSFGDMSIFNTVKPLLSPSAASPGFGLSVWLNTAVDTETDSLFLSRLPDEIMMLRGYNSERLIYDGAPADLYMAAGRYNQRLYVIPSLEMVIVRLGRANLTWSDAEFLARLLHGTTIKTP
ncbi:MAG: serine hydrolase [Balneolaceae bacterium]|nr:serine hydrolase [Balneolaceae bacterium]